MRGVETVVETATHVVATAAGTVVGAVESVMPDHTESHPNGTADADAQNSNEGSGNM